MKTISRSMVWVVGALASAFIMIACGPSNNNPTPPTFTTGSGGSAGEGGQGGAGGGSGGAAGNGGGGGGANCDGPSGCYACPPKSTDQFLNACTNAQCSAFDNVARLPLYNSGNLPPLP
jgi:hypothetical protein